MLASIQKRVSMWNEMAPFYSDATSGAGKEVESRNAESVLNAIILSSYDRAGYDGQGGHLSPTTLTAFANAWALQSTSGRQPAHGYGRTSITRRGVAGERVSRCGAHGYSSGQGSR